MDNSHCTVGQELWPPFLLLLDVALACGFITSALKMNHYSTLFVAVSLLAGD